MDDKITKQVTKSIRVEIPIDKLKQILIQWCGVDDEVKEFGENTNFWFLDEKSNDIKNVKNIIICRKSTFVI